MGHLMDHVRMDAARKFCNMREHRRINVPHFMLSQAILMLQGSVLKPVERRPSGMGSGTF